MDKPGRLSVLSAALVVILILIASSEGPVRLSLSDPTRVMWARGLGTALWWLGTVLSTIMLTTVVVLLILAILPLRSRRASRGADSANSAAADENDSGSRPCWRRLRRFWFVSAMLWLALEAAGGIWLISGRIRGPHPNDAAVPPSPTLNSVANRSLPEDLSPKKPGTLTLVAMGGSTAGGDPYSPTEGVLYTPGFSFVEAAGMRLKEQYPHLEVRAHKLALGGGTLRTAYEMLCDLPVHPDVLIVYSGHNELFTRFPPEREAFSDSDPAVSVGSRPGGLFPPSLIARAIEERLGRITPTAVPPSQRRRRLFDQPLFTESEAEQIYADFHDRLDEIVRFCRRHEVEAILMIPASNESGFDPSRSWLPPGFPDDRRRELQAIYERLDSGRLSDAERVAQLEAALGLAPEFAETNFRLGREFERLGRIADARVCYQTAIDFDGYPLRASSRIAEFYRDVADRHDATLIDAREVLRKLSSNGIVGDELIHDNCHPNVHGYAALTNEILRVLEERNIPAGKKVGPADPLTAQDLLGYFSIDRHKWVEVFRFVGRDFTENLSRLRYDNTWRLEKGSAYDRAAERIAAGDYPSLNGIPDTRVLSPGVDANQLEP